MWADTRSRSGSIGRCAHDSSAVGSSSSFSRRVAALAIFCRTGWSSADWAPIQCLAGQRRHRLVRSRRVGLSRCRRAESHHLPVTIPGITEPVGITRIDSDRARVDRKLDVREARRKRGLRCPRPVKLVDLVRQEVEREKSLVLPAVIQALDPRAVRQFPAVVLPGARAQQWCQRGGQRRRLTQQAANGSAAELRAQERAEVLAETDAVADAIGDLEAGKFPLGAPARPVVGAVGPGIADCGTADRTAAIAYGIHRPQQIDVHWRVGAKPCDRVASHAVARHDDDGAWIRPRGCASAAFSHRPGTGCLLPARPWEQG